MVLDRELRCELDGERTHDRCVGVCYLDDEDVAAIMVGAVSPATASGSAAAAIVLRSVRPPTTVRRSGRATGCPGTAYHAERALGGARRTFSMSSPAPAPAVSASSLRGTD